MCGSLCSKQVAAGRQAYVVYPVIEGAKDDQPELDFRPEERMNRSSRREAEANSPLHDGVTTKSRCGKGSDRKAKAKASRSEARSVLRREAIAKEALRAATEMFEELRTGALRGCGWGCCMGG